MFLLSKKFVVLLLAVLLASCAGKKSTQDSAFAPAKKPKVKNTLKVKQLWSRGVGSSFKKDTQGFQISADSNVVYAASQSGRLAAFNLIDGKRLWSAKSKRDLLAGINVGRNHVYVANVNGEVLAYDKNTGKQQWQKQISSEVLVAPVEAGNIAIVRGQDGKIIGMNASDGEQEWQIKRELPTLSLRRDTAPIVVGKVALMGLPTGHLLAIDSSVGRALWDLPVSVPSGVNELERMRDIAGQPIVNNNIIFTNTFQGEISAIDGSSRSLRWQKKVSSHQQMAQDEQMLFVTATDSTIIAISKRTGEIAWQNDQLLRRDVSAPSVIGQYVLVFGNDGDMYFYNKEDGQIVSRSSFPGKRPIGNPIIATDAEGRSMFYVLSSNGNLYNYTIQN